MTSAFGTETPRRAWQTDELSEEWVPEPAEPSLSRARSDSGSQRGSMVINEVQDSMVDGGSRIETAERQDQQSQAGAMVEGSVAGPGSMVVKEVEAAALQEEPPAWLQAAVNGLGNMFGPNRLQRMFDNPQSPSNLETPARVPSSSFVTPSTALHRRSLRSSLARSQSLQSIPAPSDTFEFNVPRNRSSWHAQRHFAPIPEALTAQTPIDQIASLASHGAVPEPTPRPRQGRYLFSSQTGPLAERDVTVHSSVTDGSGSVVSAGPSIAFAQETPAPRPQTPLARLKPHEESDTAQSRHTPTGSPPFDPALAGTKSAEHSSKVFSYPYDTFTRNHLSRLVEEIDDLSARSAAAAQQAEASESQSIGPGHSTPPPPEQLASSRTPLRSSLGRQRQEEQEWAESFLEPTDYARESTDGGENKIDDEEEADSRDLTASRDRSRSSKRIRLHAPRSRLFGDRMPAALARRQVDSFLVASNRQSLHQPQRLVQADLPLSSRRLRMDPGTAVASLSTPVPNRRSANTDSPVHAQPRTPGAEAGGKRNLLAEAQELMARIKAKTPHLTRTTSRTSAQTLEEAQDSESDYDSSPGRVERPRAPTPTRSAWPHRLAASQVTESITETEGAELSPVTPLLDQGPETTEEETELASEEWERAAQSMRIKTPRGTESPRKLLRRLTAAEEVDMDMERHSQVDDDVPPLVWEVHLDDREVDPEEEEAEEDMSEPVGKEAQFHPDQHDPRHERLVSSAAATLRRVLSNDPAAHAGPSKTSTLNSQHRSAMTQPIPPPPYSRGSRGPMSASVPASSRTVSTATAPSTMTSAMTGAGRMSQGTVNSNAHWGSRMGLMTIAPEDVEDLLVQGRVGKMVFDPTLGKWVRSKRMNGSQGGGVMVIEAPGLPATIVEESEWRGDDGNETTSSEEDIFKDIESLTSRRASSLSAFAQEQWDEVDREQRDDDSVDDEAPDGEDEELTAPIEVDNFDDPVAGTMETHDDPADRHVEEAGRERGIAPVSPKPSTPVLQPRSALKVRDRRPRIPADELREEATKANRSVSFSDGRTSGKILPDNRVDIAERTLLNVPADAEGSHSEVSSRTKRLEAAIHELQVVADTPSSSASSTPSTTLLGLGNGKRIRPKAGLRRSTNSDDGTDRRANGNATFLTECSFGVSHDHMVKAITDVEPYEPAWEHLKVVDLSGKQIETVVRMKELLPRLDEVNLENNNLPYLTGLPGSIRTLLASSNSLTGVSSFGHLLNLERLDISNNRIESVEQLSCLRHLRELKADGCGLSDITGLSDLDGLVKLSLKGNALQILKLGATRWSRLEVLNLSHNSISDVEDLQALSALQLLNLDYNDLYSLEFAEPMPRLRVLRLCNNHIDRVNVRSCPNLRTLYIDGCDLTGIEGASRLRKLENLSVRDQRSKTTSLPLKYVRDVKRLYLSGNRLPENLFRQSYFNLVYLELAMCQADGFPMNLAELIPNVRTLNLNYNFFHDLRPLTALTRLQKLMVLGSRLKTCGKGVIEVLSTLPELELLDLRMNPATLGFYPPLLVDNTADDKAPHVQYRIISSRAAWSEVDAKFRKALPNAYYLKRATYRAVILHSCPRLRILDGLLVAKADRARSAKLLRGLERKMAQGGDPADFEYDCSVATEQTAF